ncbi:MAG: hypothetical protein ACYC9Z_01725 [Casimicrobiaceae bacterium]
MKQPMVTIEVASGPATVAQPIFVSIEAQIDPEVPTLSLPPATVKRLGLKMLGTRTARQGKREIELQIVGPVWVQAGGRRTYVDSVMRRGKARFGYIPLAAMDLVLKEKNSKVILAPRISGRRESMAKGFKN